MKQLVALLLGVVAFFTGCASGPDFKTYSASLSAPADGQARVWFYRPSRALGTLVQPTVLMNEVAVGKSQPGAFFCVDKEPGTYEIKCQTEWADKAQLTVERNKVSYVRLTLLPGVFVGHILPKVVPEEKALKELEKCKLITADGANKDWKDKNPAATK